MFDHVLSLYLIIILSVLTVGSVFFQNANIPVTWGCSKFGRPKRLYSCYKVETCVLKFRNFIDSSSLSLLKVISADTL